MDQNLEALVRDAQVVLVVGMQWGDEGKGKITDMLMPYFDAVVRFQGGRNAGHTVVVGNQTYKFHLVPSGILQGKTAIIADGVALNAGELLTEVEELKAKGVEVDSKLKVSSNAGVVMPYHIWLDEAKENNGNGIGSTRNGIGPFYIDRNNFRGLTVSEVAGSGKNSS